jgi:hypothetical protein
MLPKTPRSAASPSSGPSPVSPWRWRAGRTDGPRSDHVADLGRWARILAPRALVGAALLLAGGVAGLAAGQSMANRAAHRAGACSALNMAAALGYLDADQQRRLRHALSTALNPDVGLFSAGRSSLPEKCGTGAGG